MGCDVLHDSKHCMSFLVPVLQLMDHVALQCNNAASREPTSVQPGLQALSFNTGVAAGHS